MSDAEIGRYTPYEAVFHAEGFDESVFEDIAEQGVGAGADLSSRSQFARVAPASAALERLVPESFDAAALDRYVEILFHGFHFWRAGRPFYAFTPSVVRRLIEDPPDLSDWTLAVPHPALYIELPKNLFWAAVTEATPEPVEGMFVRAAANDSLDLLLVLGMWPDRPGFSAAALTLPARAGSASAEPDAFRSDIPGADLAELYSIRSGAEAIVLLARLIWFLESRPDAIHEEPAAADAEGAEKRLTRLAYRRVGPTR